MLCLTYVITIIYAHHVSYHSKHAYVRVQSGIRNKQSCLVCAGEQKAKFKFFLDQCPIPTSETVSSARVKVARHKTWDRRSPRNLRESYTKLMPFFYVCSIFQRPPTSFTAPRSLLHTRRPLYRSWDSLSNFSPSKYRWDRHLRRGKGERSISVETPNGTWIEFLSGYTFAKMLLKMENSIQ